MVMSTTNGQYNCIRTKEKQKSPGSVGGCEEKVPRSRGELVYYQT